MVGVGGTLSSEETQGGKKLRKPKACSEEDGCAEQLTQAETDSRGVRRHAGKVGHTT